MAKIGKDQIEQLYIIAKRFHKNELKLKDARAYVESLGINKNSGIDYIYNLGHLLNGRTFARTMNILSTEYYLEKIRADYGTDALAKALLSLSLNIDYYENASRTKVKGRRKVLDKYLAQLQVPLDSYYGEEIDEKKIYEGARKTVSMNIYERTPLARAKCVEHFGAICQVCSYDFEKVFGIIGRGFIHIHHLKEISNIGTEYEVDFRNDLVPVCPNCHAILHKRKPAYTINELKEIIASNKI